MVIGLVILCQDSRTYMKMSGKLDKDEPATGFLSSPEETQTGQMKWKYKMILHTQRPVPQSNAVRQIDTSIYLLLEEAKHWKIHGPHYVNEHHARYISAPLYIYICF